MHARLILFCSWLVSSTATATAVQADALWQKGDYRGAFAEAFEPAAHGDAHAQFLLGEAYRLGRSVGASFPQAEDWYMRAAFQGDVAASTELGLLYANQHRGHDALPWLSRAALHGDNRALCSLAALYFNGDGVDSNPILAFALMSRAAATGFQPAKERLITLRFALSPDAQVAGQALAASGWEKALQPAVAQAVRPPTIASAKTPATMRLASVTTGTRAKAPRVRIQIGAYGSAEAAEHAWTMLAGQISRKFRANHVVESAGAVYRLKVSLQDESAAAYLVRKLEASHWQYLTLRAGPGTNSLPAKL